MRRIRKYKGSIAREDESKCGLMLMIVCDE
jgi:hypothetical protein